MYRYIYVCTSVVRQLGIASETAVYVYPAAFLDLYKERAPRDVCLSGLEPPDVLHSAVMSYFSCTQLSHHACTQMSPYTTVILP